MKSTDMLRQDLFVCNCILIQERELGSLL